MRSGAEGAGGRLKTGGLVRPDPEPIEGRGAAEGREEPPIEGREEPPIEGREEDPIEGREEPPIEPPPPLGRPPPPWLAPGRWPKAEKCSPGLNTGASNDKSAPSSSARQGPFEIALGSTGDFMAGGWMAGDIMALGSANSVPVSGALRGPEGGGGRPLGWTRAASLPGATPGDLWGGGAVFARGSGSRPPPAPPGAPRFARSGGPLPGGRGRAQPGA